MKIFVRSILISMLAFTAAPAYADEAFYVFTCERDENATDEQVQTAAQEWLKAAREMKGGKDMEAYLMYPAVGATNQVDMRFVVTSPSIEEWGMFWGNYDDSPADEVDQKHKDLVDCANSSLWNSETVEIK